MHLIHSGLRNAPQDTGLVPISQGGVAPRNFHPGECLHGVTPPVLPTASGMASPHPAKAEIRATGQELHPPPLKHPNEVIACRLSNLGRISATSVGAFMKIKILA